MDKRKNGRMKLTAEEKAVMTMMIRLAMKTSMILLMTMTMTAKMTMMAMMMYLQESSGLTLAQQQLLAAAGD